MVPIKNNYYLKIILLNDCPYSEKAKQIINENKIPVKIINVNYENKELYKNDNINTYPQIYLNKKGSKSNLLLGGFTDLSESINNFKSLKSESNLDNSVNNFMNKYKWSKKATLRFIQLFN
jgi:glutaredoxin